MVVKQGDKWIVKSKEGKTLSRPYMNEEDAKRRLAEIEAWKHIKAKGGRVK